MILIFILFLAMMMFILLGIILGLSVDSYAIQIFPSETPASKKPCIRLCACGCLFVPSKSYFTMRSSVNFDVELLFVVT